MTKKQTPQKQKATSKKELILWIAIGILLVAHIVSAWYLVRLWNNTEAISKESLYTLVNRSEESRYRQPVIDVAENRVYIPEARIYMPLNDASRDMRYDYRANGEQPATLYLSTASVVGRQSEQHDASCDKIITLSQTDEPNRSYWDLAGTLQPTKDDFRYIFMHKQESCWAHYDETRKVLAEVAKMIKNY